MNIKKLYFNGECKLTAELVRILSNNVNIRKQALTVHGIVIENNNVIVSGRHDNGTHFNDVFDCLDEYHVDRIIDSNSIHDLMVLVNKEVRTAPVSGAALCELRDALMAGMEYIAEEETNGDGHNPRVPGECPEYIRLSSALATVQKLMDNLA